MLAIPPVDGEGRGLVVDAAWGRAGPVAALGFPEQLGLAEDGSVVRDRTEHGFVMRALAVIAHFDGPRGLAVDAGAVPLGGISGGPVVNGAGHVVAIDTGVRSHRAKGGDVTWSLVVNELDGLAEWLREEAPQALISDREPPQGGRVADAARPLSIRALYLSSILACSGP